MPIDYWDAERLRDRLTPERAVEALRTRLRLDPPSLERSVRFRQPTEAGQLLIMPDESSRHVGIKLLSSSPDNPARGLPLVQGVYLLMDAETNTPIALMDAAELSLIRTSAVTTLALMELRPVARPRVVIVGSGPQAVAHAEAARLLGAGMVQAVVRSEEAARRLHDSAVKRSVAVEPVGEDATAGADVIICVTSSPVPVVDDASVGPHAVVAAIGAHESHTRELPTGLMERAAVFVESRRNALMDSGDILIAQEELGRPIHLQELGELVAGSADVPIDRPRVYVSVGEAWEDLAVASALL